MTEYELIDAINGLASNLATSQSLFISALFGYLILAYAIGDKLTTFQVVFVSVVFAFVSATGTSAFLTMSTSIAELSVRHADATGSEAVFSDYGAMLGIPRAVMVVGALVFMRQVRHPKTE